MNYWDNYYANSDLNSKLIPSQFAAFVAGELKKNSYIIDIGCGNGRDSFFLAL